jgi:hypothetical protein
MYLPDPDFVRLVHEDRVERLRASFGARPSRRPLHLPWGRRKAAVSPRAYVVAETATPRYSRQ